MTQLSGQQLSMLPGVKPYPLTNPSSPEQTTEAFQQGDRVWVDQISNTKTVPSLSPEQVFRVGDWVRVKAVQPHQSKRWLGQSGKVVRLTQVRVRVELPKLSGEGLVEVPLPPDYLERIAHPNRRHSQKGHASGWIEERQGNKKRKTPSTSYFYCWLEEGQRKKRYVPIGKLYRVNQMLDQRRPIKEIVEFLQVKERL